MASEDSIKAITESLPPKSDYLTYLTILESHLSPNVLPTLFTILQDVELTQNIGWDLIYLLLPISGSEDCLRLIARLGNPREVVLKVTEALQILDLEDETEEETATNSAAEPSAVDKFCILVDLLSILLPRIKTKYPSRFLSTSLMAILSTYRPSCQTTQAVVSFLHTMSGKKRPPLPGRKSSYNIPQKPRKSEANESAPDPEAQEEDPQEAAIQSKLLQSFLTHILEEYVNKNSLEWAARLQESFEPEKVVTGRKSVGESFKDEPSLIARDTIVGQLVALLRDLGLSDYSVLFEAIHKTESHPAEYDSEENYPSSPGDIPLSQAGSLFLVTSSIFSSVMFGSKIPPPEMTIFPDHAKLVLHFIGTDGPNNIGSEEPGVIDAILAIGLWLENSNKFINGPLEDSEFLQQLQSLSLLSANNPSPTIRYAAHCLTTSLLHAHPMDRLRLTFITDTLEHCPIETLRSSAVLWLKEEIKTAHERKSDNAFASTIALAASQPYLFPDLSALAEATDEELVQALEPALPFHMAVLNFLFFICHKDFSSVVPPGMISVVEQIYLGPLKLAQERVHQIPAAESGKGESMLEFDLLKDMISMSSAQIESSR